VPAGSDQLQLFPPRCPHLLVTVHKTQDLQFELALCRDCGKEVEDWETRRQPKGTRLVYRYVEHKDDLIRMLEDPPPPVRLATDPPKPVPAHEKTGRQRKPVVDLDLDRWDNEGGNGSRGRT
jgi:hypothetical protein